MYSSINQSLLSFLDPRLNAESGNDDDDENESLNDTERQG